MSYYDLIRAFHQIFALFENFQAPPHEEAVPTYIISSLSPQKNA